MAGEWSRVGNLSPDIDVQPAIGDTWVDRHFLEQSWPVGRVSITDVLPFTPKDEAPKPVERVTIEYQQTGARESMPVAELRRRFAFRRKA